MESYGNDRMSFGEAFGRLIKQKRGVEGLTQQELAVLAFGKEANKTRISELENGRVANPQAKTVDALIIALKISQDEIDQLDVEHRDPYMVDTLPDYIDYSERPYAEVELTKTIDGAVALNINCPLKIEIERFEYFHDLKSLVVLTKDNSRRTVSSSIPDYIWDRLAKADYVRVILWEWGPQPMALEHTHYPLKIIL